MSGSEIDRHLGRKVSEARKQQAHSVEALAQLIEIEPTALAAIESGETRVASLVVARVARTLDLPLSWFFEGLPGQEVFDAPRTRRSV